MPDKKPEPSSTWLRILQGFINGSVGGVIESVVNHPLAIIKYRVQNGEPIIWTRAELYRGTLADASASLPVTAIQVGVTKGILLRWSPHDEPKNYQKITSAFCAGVMSAAVLTPTEMIMIYQGTTKQKFLVTGKILVGERGWRSLSAGLGITGVKEGIFSASFLGVAPLLKQAILPYSPHDKLAGVVAGLGAGIGAVVISQAADTLKTAQQKAAQTEAVNLKTMAVTIYSKSGWRGFFKGGAVRGVQVASAVTVLSMLTEYLEKKFHL